MNRYIVVLLGCVVFAGLGGGSVQAQPTPYSGSEFQVNTFTTSVQYYTRVCRADNGNFVVTWSSYGQDGSGFGVFGQRYASSGAALGGEFRVNTTIGGHQFQGGSVACAPNGDFVAIWSSGDGSGFGTFGQRYASDGTARGGQFQVNAYTTNWQTRGSVCVADSGDFVVVWDSYDQEALGSHDGIFGQRYASDGTALGGEFQVNTYTTSRQFEPSVDCKPDGDFVVVWASALQDGSGYGVFGQRYASGGAALGGEFQVNSFTNGHQLYTHVAVGDGGNFVVSWAGGGDGDNWGTIARLFDSTGAPTTTDFLTNPYTTGAQVHPSVSVAPDGAFAVVWVSADPVPLNSQDGDRAGVFGHLFTSAGFPVGSEFQVNTYTTHYQTYPYVACDPNGGFVVAWFSETQDGDSHGVFARQYCRAAALAVSPQPVNQTACPGDSVQLGLGTAGGQTPLAYQWRKGGTPLVDGGNVSGATTATLTINPVGAGDAGDYDCVVTDGCTPGQSATSTVATVTVNPPPPGPVGPTLLLAKINGGTDIQLTWTDVAGAADYELFEDADPAGTFGTSTGTAASGAPGLTIPIPGGSLVSYLVAGRNACGTGPKK